MLSTSPSRWTMGLKQCTSWPRCAPSGLYYFDIFCYTFMMLLHIFFVSVILCHILCYAGWVFYYSCLPGWASWKVGAPSTTDRMSPPHPAGLRFIFTALSSGWTRLTIWKQMHFSWYVISSAFRCSLKWEVLAIIFPPSHKQFWSFLQPTNQTDNVFFLLLST